MIVCVRIPYFALASSPAASELSLLSEPVALAWGLGRRQLIGEVSPAAFELGVVSQMPVSTALAVCPELKLVPPDPARTRSRWIGLIDQLTDLGAEVESDVEGLLFFEATGLYNLYGGGLFGVLEVTRRSLFQYLHRAICDTEQGICTGVAPSRFSAHLAALEKPKGASELVVSAAELDGFLEPLSVTFLGLRRRLADLPNTLERLGIRTLGKLRSLSRASLAERFGPQGLEAHDLARGADTPLQPQGPTQPVTESIELHDSVTALQLEKMLELLTERLLQRPERRERSIRSLVVCADFADGGNWRAPAVLRQSSADSARILPTLFLKLSKLPGPPVRLALEVGDFGPPAQAQEHLADAFAGSQLRKSRLGESVKQLRGTVADDAVLRVLELDRDSPLPEKRAVLAPFERRA